MLVAAVVGSGIMAQRLTDDIAVVLLCNSIATGAILIVLIAVLGPLSGAHLNPAVSLVFALRRELKASEALLYMLVQVVAGIAGALVAHAMFELPLVSASLQPRTGGGQWLSEAIAAFGLVFVILAGLKVDRRSVPWLVGLFIASAYWFTASTSFANPAVTVARALTDSFSGIRLVDVPGFVAAQLVGAFCAWAAATWLLAGGSRPIGQRQQ
jgi:glycerol uptake facilitator-like aquaporin